MKTDRMKRVFGILLILLTANSLLATCPEKSIEVWPVRDTLPQNPVLLITAKGDYIKVVKNLNVTYKAYLQSPTDRVSLDVLELHYGAQNEVEVLLRPYSQLKPGLRYTFIINGLNGTEDFTTHTYYIRSGIDGTFPKFLELPALASATTLTQPEGKAEFASFKVQARDELPFLYEVSLLNVKNISKEIKYLVDAGGKELQIGTLPCYANFQLVAGQEYQVLITAMDAAGNHAPAPAGWIRFKFDPMPPRQTKLPAKILAKKPVKPRPKK